VVEVLRFGRHAAAEFFRCANPRGGIFTTNTSLWEATRIQSSRRMDEFGHPITVGRRVSAGVVIRMFSQFDSRRLVDAVVAFTSLIDSCSGLLLGGGVDFFAAFAGKSSGYRDKIRAIVYVWVAHSNVVLWMRSRGVQILSFCLVLVQHKTLQREGVRRLWRREGNRRATVATGG